MKNNRYKSPLPLIACAFLFLEAPICRADVTFDVSIDTSGLIGHPAGPFYIDFQLNDGSGDYSFSVNRATISNFTFEDGRPTGIPQLLGGATGSLDPAGPGVKLTDNAHFINQFFQPFTPGRSLKFTVSLTTNVDPGLTPDAFSFLILDNRLSPIPTRNFADAFVFVNINSVNLTAADLGNSIFAGDPTRPPLAGGDAISIGKPVVRETDQPPTITGAAVDKPVLWPPNHQLANITVNYEVTDDQPLPPNSCTLGATSNEPINGTGGGDTSPDWIISGAHHVQLRAERAGNGNGRIYTITITCVDSGGNSSSKSVAVSVPHDRGKK